MTWSPCLNRHLHADHHGLLADIEMAEAADQAHAVELAGLLLEAADEQHLAVGGELLVAAEGGDCLLTIGAGHPGSTRPLWKLGHDAQNRIGNPLARPAGVMPALRLRLTAAGGCASAASGAAAGRTTTWSPRAHEAQQLDGEFLDDVGGLRRRADAPRCSRWVRTASRRSICDSSCLERSINRTPRLEAALAIDGMMDEVGQRKQTEKQHQDLSRRALAPIVHGSTWGVTRAPRSVRLGPERKVHAGVKSR